MQGLRELQARDRSAAAEKEEEDEEESENAERGGYHIDTDYLSVGPVDQPRPRSELLNVRALKSPKKYVPVGPVYQQAPRSELLNVRADNSPKKYVYSADQEQALMNIVEKFPKHGKNMDKYNWDGMLESLRPLFPPCRTGANLRCLWKKCLDFDAHNKQFPKQLKRWGTARKIFEQEEEARKRQAP